MWNVKNLKYQTGSFTLDIPSLSSKNEQICLMMGPSGCGKTTFLQLLIGLIAPAGPWSWSIEGIELSTLSVADRRLGVVFQSYDLFPHLTAQQNVHLVMKARSNWTTESQRQLEEHLDILDLKKCWLTKAENLSGGEKQRVALLRAVMSRPRALLMDEPFSALDKNLKDESRHLVKSLIHRLQMPTIIVTHDEEDQKHFGARVIRMNEGRVIGEE